MSFPEHIDASPTLLFGACTVLLLSLDSNVECARLLHFFLKNICIPHRDEYMIFF